jgi:hypothetical protein
VKTRDFPHFAPPPCSRLRDPPFLMSNGPGAFLHPPFFTSHPRLPPAVGIWVAQQPAPGARGKWPLAYLAPART